jgi:isoleucyl-tRNA synthetase
VRRNRRRFWKASSREDALAAYQTLYEALTTLSRLFAPVMPFVAEAMHLNLVRGVIEGAPDSVHLTGYPEAHPERIDDQLEKEMRAAMRVVALGRAARSAAAVKTRTPLPKLVVVFDRGDRDTGILDGQEALAAMICDELNVKAFEVRADAAGLVQEVVKPDLKLLGPRLGKDLPRVRAALAEGRYEASDAGIAVLGFTLGPDEVLRTHEGAPGHAVGADAGAVVALETTLTPDLEAEGLARELVRRVNDLRKDAGFAIADRIVLRYAGAIGPTVERFAELVGSETLATGIHAGIIGRGHPWSGELNGTAAALELERA